MGVAGVAGKSVVWPAPARTQRQGFRSTIILIFCLAVAALLPTAPVHAGGDEPPAAASSENDKADLDRAKTEVLGHLRASRFAEAMPSAERALRLSERLHGADARETAIAAQNLAFALRRTGRDAEAQPHLEHARAIYERSLPAINEDMRNATGELGQIYLKAGRGADVTALYEGLIARATREGDGQQVGTAHLHNNLAFALRILKRRDESRAHWSKAITIYAAQASQNDDAYLSAINALVDEYLATSEFDKARDLLTSALQSSTAQQRDNGRTSVRIARRLAELEHTAGNYKRSRQLSLEALASLDAKTDAKPDPGATDLMFALNNLARAEKALGSYSEAEHAYKRMLVALDAIRDPLNAAIANDNLAVLYGEMGRWDEAEERHKRALPILEEKLGRAHRTVGETLGNLGAVLFHMQRYAEAEPLLRRALEIAEAQKPQDPVGIAIVSDNLAGLFRLTDRREPAQHYLRRALTSFEKALPATHPSIGTARNNLGRYLLDTAAYPEAETQLLKSLEISEANVGAQHPANAIILSNLGELYSATKRYDRARDMLTRSVDILGRTFGPNHASLSIPLVRLGSAELADGRAPAAVSAFGRAVDIEIVEQSRGNGISTTERREPLAGRQAFEGLIEASWRSEDQRAAATIARAFEAGEWASMSAATRALTALAARFGANDPAIGPLVRERQDLGAEWRARDKRLTNSLSQSGDRNADLETALRERLGAIETRLKAIDQEMQTAFPRFGDLSQPKPVNATEVQGLLKPNEAAIQFVVTPSSTHAWLVTKTETQWARLPTGNDELAGLVKAIRCGLDRAEWQDKGAARCAGLLGLTADKIPGDSDALPFDLARAHKLYKLLFAPFEAATAGKDLLIVATGPLTALPFHVLVSESPGVASPQSSPDYARAKWIARDHGVTIIPSLASLRALRQFAQASAATGAFMGFGNPLLTGRDGTDRRAWEQQTCAKPSVAGTAQHVQTAVLQTIAKLSRGSLGDVDALLRQPPLPETAGELCRVAQTLQANDHDVFLGGNATEAKVKALSLSGALANARVLHFATHGLLAGETALFSTQLSEPALILSPPKIASEEDDGLLTASEIATLKLDADWVVLSACNTASGSNDEAEALSGLARAFFYAGARALLVSHWAVDSNATVKLITMTFDDIKKSPGLGRAQALRRSMLAMIDQGGLEAHPAYWAPFIVVGEGSGAVQEAQTAPEIGRTKAKTIAPRAAGASAKKASQARGPSARGKSNDGDWPSSFFAR